MDRQIFSFAPPTYSRNESLYNLCLFGSIGMFLLNLLYIFLLFSFVMKHDYTVITEIIASVIMVFIAFGCFVSLATLYSVTMNEHSYHYLRPVCLTLTGSYLAILTIAGLGVLIESMTNVKYWELFTIIIWPVVGEYVIYMVVAYSFYNLYTLSPSYVIVPSMEQTRIQPTVLPKFFYAA